MDANKFLLLLIIALCGLRAEAACDGLDVSKAYFSEAHKAYLKALVQPGDGLKRILVFGDSLSDTGRLARRSLGIAAPACTYWQSRLSNGPNWSDYVSGATAWPQTSYAVAGAETQYGRYKLLSDALWNFLFSLFIQHFSEQIEEFVKDDQKAAFDRERTLVVIWVGHNNYYGHAQDDQDTQGRPIPEAVERRVNETIGDVARGARRLLSMGFKNLIIGDSPQLHGTMPNPEAPSPISDETLQLSQELHNIAVVKLLQKLRSEYSSQNLLHFQANLINSQSNATPLAFGFTRFDEQCYKGNFFGKALAAGKLFCDDPKGHKFWDRLHPNTLMHCYYAAQFLADLRSARLVDSADREELIQSCLNMAPS